jgi:sulfur relay (sulfurtransferase) DsrF/TusC family protein
MNVSKRVAVNFMNGVILMFSIFLIWIPFLYFIGFGFIRNTILQQLCNKTDNAFLGIINMINTYWDQLWADLNQKLPSNFAPYTNVFEYLATILASGIYQDIRSVLITDEPPLTLENEAWNSRVYTIMWSFLALFGLFTFYICKRTIKAYGIDWKDVFYKAIIFFFGMFIAEMTFFGTIATTYVPINITEIMNMVNSTYDDMRSR